MFSMGHADDNFCQSVTIGETMQEFAYKSRAEALETAFELYLTGFWSLAFVTALYRANVSTPELAVVRWQKGPGSRFAAYIFTPSADIPLRARTPRDA